uniref:Uncharacterized protein n=1 Tax=Fagus sylvatica TaxID=28930 RepID=A0A2N9GAE7_FAGSY
MASKLAQLVNTEENMAQFRLLYQIPPAVSLTYCNSDDFPVINRGEILIPIMAIVEGGVRFPLHTLLIDFLQTVNATPSQISVNTFRIIMSVIAINRLLDVNLTIREIIAVYQYKCPGEKSNTLCHLVARKVNEKLVNGLPSTNKGYEKDYLRVIGDWFSGSSICRSEFGYPDQRRIDAERKQGNAELIRRVLSTNICVDERGEPRSAPLLLGYEPQVKLFLEGPTVPRSEASEIPPRAPYTAQPAEIEQPQDFPDRIPTGQVFAMAPPVNPFKLMGRPADASSSKKVKGKGRGNSKGTEAPKIPKKLPEEASTTESVSHPIPEQGPTSEPAKVHILEDSEQEEELQPSKKRGRIEPPIIPVEGPSSYALAWDPALLFGQHPISVRDSIMDNSNIDVSAQVARGLAFAACLPEDMKQWAGTQPGPAFCQITRDLMMGVMSMEAKFYRLTEKYQKSEAEHEKAMSEMLRAAGENHKKLEDELSRNVNLMKEAEERAWTEETKRAQAEAEIAKIQEKMKELEAECISRLGNAHKEGMEEGLKKGKELGKEGAMGEEMKVKKKKKKKKEHKKKKKEKKKKKKKEKEEKKKKKKRKREKWCKKKTNVKENGQTEPTTGLLDVVGLTEQTLVTPEQPSQEEDVPEQPSSS